jgi:hypothetical protein
MRAQECYPCCSIAVPAESSSEDGTILHMCHDAVLAEHDGDIANVHNNDMCNNVQCNHDNSVIGVEGLYSVRLKGGIYMYISRYTLSRPWRSDTLVSLCLYETLNSCSCPPGN